MLSSLLGWYRGPRAPRILVTVSISSEVLSKSSTQPNFFSITLEATVEANLPITINPTLTLLDPFEDLALSRQGLTFTNVKTGELARRPVSFICHGYQPEMTVEDAIEIPVHEGHDTAAAYKVTHFFKTPTPTQQHRTTISGRPIPALPADSFGFEVGQTYEIGLGDSLSKIRWWKWGSKKEVFSFSFHRRSRAPSEGTPELQMVLVNRARFEVVA